MSKSLKRVIGVVAAIAIPFAAPAIAGAILGSAATAFATTATSAAVGAALGAGSAAVTGGDVGKAALFGGIGGGIGGYTSAATAARAKAAADAASVAGAGGSGSIEAVNAGQSLSSMATPSGTTASQLGGMGTALGGAPVVAPTFAGGPLSTVGTQVAGLSATPAAAPAAATGSGFVQTLKNIPSQIAAKFSDPAKLADLTLRAGGQLAGSALSDSGLSPEEKGLLNAQTEELRNLQQTNRAAFDARMQQAMNLIGESRYFDPEYFGLQRARREQVAVGRQRQAGLRGLTGGRRQAEGRRYDIESGRRTGTAYDVGYGQGVAGRLQTRQAGIAAMPTEFSSQAFEGYGGLLRSYGAGAERQRQQQEDIGNLFGSFTGGYGAKKTGDEKEEEKA